MVRVFLFFLLIFFSTSPYAHESEGSNLLDTTALHPKQKTWEFEGVFGRFDKRAIERGFQVYHEVCAACHGLNRLAYRNLAEIGFSEEEIKKLAAQYSVTDGPNDEGEMFEREALPSDHFVGPYANDQAARASNGGALPPDLSLIVKARHDGANYVYSILTGFKDPPLGFKMNDGKSYNPYFEGRQISMPPPLTDDGQIEYQDGTYATKEQMASDVANFLQWVAEPEMEARKKMGVRTFGFLLALFIFAFLAKKAVWKSVQ